MSDAFSHAAANHSNLTGRRSVQFPLPAPLVIGQTISHYRVLEKLRGGMGLVYEA
jgi:hypothetical protein